MKRSTYVLALVMAAVMAGAGLGASASAADAKTKITVGATPIVNAAPLYIGVQKGFFSKEGLDVKPTIIQTPASTIPSLLNGQLQYAMVSAVPTITARSKGLPIKIALGNERISKKASHEPVALLVKSGSSVRTAADLEGKTVAVVGLKSAPELAVRLTVKKAGGDPRKVRFVEIPYPDMVASLTAGRVDAVLGAEPFILGFQAKGLRAIAHPFSKALPGVAGTLWISSDRFLSKQAGAAKRFAKAMKKSIAYAAAHPDAVRESLKLYTKIPAAALPQLHLPEFSASVRPSDLKLLARAMTEQGFLRKMPNTSSLIQK